jgi:serine phosphatase RsbU (regulator of sigma subunit)
MGRLLLTPQSLQYLAQTILAAVLCGYLFARARRPGATRDLARFFAWMTAGLLLLFLDRSWVGPGAKVFIDAVPCVFQVAGAALLTFAYRFPAVPPGAEARWAVRAAWAAVLADLALAGPNVVRSLGGRLNPVAPFRVELILVSLAALWIVAVFTRRALREHGLARRERGALVSFAGLVAILLLVGVASYLSNVGTIPLDLFLSIRTAGFLVFLFAFVVIHLNVSPEPSELMAKLVGLSLVATLLALALAAALLPPAAPAATGAGPDLAALRAAEHRQAAPLAILMLGLPAAVLLLFPLLLRAGLRRPLSALLDGVRRVNDGDLSVEVPVRIEDEIGYLARSFNRMVRSVREALAARERAAAVERELAIARRIQEGLLPESLPGVGGVAAAARLVPAATMSGDIYDAVPADSGLALLTVDVSGHGVSAALVAAMAKLAFAQASARTTDPAAVLAEMNAVLAGRMGTQFLTGSCVHVDPARGLARFGCAGHPPALLLRDESVRAVKPDGLLIGFMPEARYETREIALAAGDRILLYTDGVTECLSPADEQFGEERLSAELRDGAGLPPEAFADRLLERLRAWSGRDGPFEDDVTLLVADYRPQIPL